MNFKQNHPMKNFNPKNFDPKNFDSKKFDPKKADPKNDVLFRKKTNFLHKTQNLNFLSQTLVRPLFKAKIQGLRL